MSARTTMLGIYGPVLLAAVLIMGAVPGCIMPDCELGVGSAAGFAACSPSPSAPQHFRSACDGRPIHAPAPAPCHDEGSCDAVMSHGSPDAVASAGVDVPPAAVVASAVELPGQVVAQVAFDVASTAEPPPPDPLGVRLLI